MRRISYIVLVSAIAASCFCGCGKESGGMAVSGENNEILSETEETQEAEPTEKSEEPVDEMEENNEDVATDSEAPLEEVHEDVILIFRDVFGVSYETVVNPDIPATPYNNARYSHDGNKMSYEDEEYTSRLGIDVSHHQGKIDWNAVKEAGFEFVFIRIGYRGYGKTGSINLDKEFDNNIRKAQEAGLDVGVYFFSQAINEEEAIEEADFVISHLQEYELQLPVVYDPESILDDEARTDDVTGEQFTANSVVFCERIAAEGLTPAIYSNMLWEAFELDLTQLPGIPVWYADYEDVPQTPYAYEYLQYSNEASVPGVSGICDVNIQLIKK